ncbi:MAG: DUF2207 domain-containing protein [Agathobacter sp.]|nr:DUF2207 domain-containing protein [Agathobacter sp.]
MKKFICWLLLLIVVVSPFTINWLTNLGTNPFDYARITDVDYQAKVVDEPGSNGKVIITERLTFDIHALDKDNPFWELWRELPERLVDGVKVTYKVNSVKQILDDGTEKVWEESDMLYWDDEDFVEGPGKWYHSKGPYDEDLRRYECLLFYVDGIYRDKITFEIEYEMYNAVLRYADCTNLYLSMWSGSSIRYLDSFDAEVLIPNDKMPEDYSVVSYGTNKEPFEIKESANKNDGYYTFYFNLDKSDLNFTVYNEYIEFDMLVTGKDKFKFSEYASKNSYSDEGVVQDIKHTQKDYFDEVEAVKVSRIKVIGLCSLVFLAIVAVTIYEFKRMKSDKHFSPKKTKSLYRQIPSNLDPKFAAAFIRIKDKKKANDASVYAAVLLSLARKGYVELTESGKDMTIKINKKASTLTVPESISKKESLMELEPLTHSEKYYLELIQRHTLSDTIQMSYLQRRITADYDYTDDFVKNMKDVVSKCGYHLKYFESSYNKHQNELFYLYNACDICSFTALVGHLFFTVLYFGDVSYFCIILSVLLMIMARVMEWWSHRCVLLTPLGEAEYIKWRGLYNFLKSDTLLDERTVVELPLWEQYLVYATAFGISDKVIKAIKVRCPEMAAQQNINTRSIVYNRSFRSGHFRTHTRSFSSHVSRGSQRAIKYSSGGGGFSGGYRGGGGRGGGGGGGGH